MNMTLASWSDAYYDLHGYLGLCLTVFGVLTNSVTAVVLNQRKLRSNINLLLTGIAVMHVITNLFCSIYLIHFRVERFECVADRDSLDWATFELLYANIPQCSCAASVCLTMSIACWRYFVLVKPVQRRALIQWNPKVACIVMFACFVFVTILLTPQFLSYKIGMRLIDISSRPHNSTNGSLSFKQCSNITYIVEWSDRAKDHPIIIRMNFGIYGLMFKLVPCVVLIIATLGMICRIKKGDCRMRITSLRRHQPTTGLLIAIVLCTVVSVLPHTVLTVLVMWEPQKHIQIYGNCGDMLELLTLIEMSTTFILYTCTSSHFRKQILEIFACSPRKVNRVTDVLGPPSHGYGRCPLRLEHYVHPEVTVNRL